MNLTISVLHTSVAGDLTSGAAINSFLLTVQCLHSDLQESLRVPFSCSRQGIPTLAFEAATY